MPVPIREQLLAQFFVLLEGLGDFVFKKRMSNFSIEDLIETPALLQIDGGASFLGGDDQSSGSSGVMQIAQRVYVYVIVRQDTTEAVGPALWQRAAEVLAAVNHQILPLPGSHGFVACVATMIPTST